VLYRIALRGFDESPASLPEELVFTTCEKRPVSAGVFKRLCNKA
jgi:hypothetical protein